MKRLIIAVVAGGIAGIALGFASGIFIYPFWFLNDAAEESLAAGVERQQIATGEFIHVNPSDPVHYGKGMVTLYRENPGGAVVHLGEDFEVGPGPRFHVYLVDNGMVDSKAAFQNSAMVDLGRLRAFRGSQVYAVPAGIDVADYGSVVIWCKEFEVLISPASLVSADPKIADAGANIGAGS